MLRITAIIDRPDLTAADIPMQTWWYSAAVGIASLKVEVVEPESASLEAKENDDEQRDA